MYLLSLLNSFFIFEKKELTRDLKIGQIIESLQIMVFYTFTNMLKMSKTLNM